MSINVTFTPDAGFGADGTKLNFKVQAAQIAAVDGKLVLSGPAKPVTATVGQVTTLQVNPGQPYLFADLRQGDKVIRTIVTMPTTARDISADIAAAAAIPVTTPTSTITAAVEAWLEQNVDPDTGGGSGLTLTEDPNRPGIYLEA